MLVSAAISDGPPRRILELASQGRFELVLPEPALIELERILGAKLHLDPGEIAPLLDLLAELAPDSTLVPAPVPALSGDDDDDRIIAAALRAGADVLVSGDAKHVLPLGRVESMRIVRPQTLVAELDDAS